MFGDNAGYGKIQTSIPRIKSPRQSRFAVAEEQTDIVPPDFDPVLLLGQALGILHRRLIAPCRFGIGNRAVIAFENPDFVVPHKPTIYSCPGTKHITMALLPP